MGLFGSYSHVVIVGNMTRDIEVRTLPSGTQVADMAVAVNERIKKGDQWVDETSFVDCTVFGKTAELIQRFGGKGKKILAEGRLRQDKWVDKASGQNRTKLKVLVDNITFLDSAEGKGGGGGRGASAGRAPAHDMPYDAEGADPGFDESTAGGYGGGANSGGGGYGGSSGGGGAPAGHAGGGRPAPAGRGRGAAPSPAEVPYAQSWDQADTGGGETPF
jgi:single-strand DNA-binding protein